MKEKEIKSELKELLLKEIDNDLTVLIIESKIDELILSVFSRAFKEALNSKSIEINSYYN